MREKLLRKTQGITLIALVITIIVLLILAGVSVSMFFGNNGVLQKATDAKQANQNAEDLEKVQLAAQAALVDGLGTINLEDKDLTTETKGSFYEALVEEFGNGSTEVTTYDNGKFTGKDGKQYIVSSDGNVIEGKEITKVIDNGTNTKITFSNNTNIIDEYGNVFILPAGFKVTNDAKNVTAGIVIEDVSAKNDTSKGNQFVWIPVGDVKKSDGTTVNITLGRYVFDEKNGTIDETLTQAEPSGQLKTKSTNTDYFTDSEAGAFKTSANLNHGYYIGRYEAGDSKATLSNNPRSKESTEGILVCKKDQQVYNWIKKADAKDKSTAMYSSTKFTSDLINSFAWDTAILFEQTFDNRTTDKTKPYSRQNSLNTGSPTTTGTTDKICNIYDMASNVCEWTTETYSDSSYPCVLRGGNCNYSNYFTSYRRYNSDSASENSGFRLLLYL